MVMLDPKLQDVKEWALAHIESARDALEAHAPETATAQHRGEIKACRALLAYLEPTPRDPEQTVQPAGAPDFVGPEF